MSPVRPFVRELVDAGYLPRHIGSVGIGGMVATPLIEIYAGREPVPLHLIQTREEYFRHDMRTSPLYPLFGDATVASLEDKAAERKGRNAKKEERREVNESMPHAFQAVAAGTPMTAELRLVGATTVEWECLAYAVVRWIAHGAHLGGGLGRGHGACNVRCAGALSYQPPVGVGAAHPGTSVSIERAGEAYPAHLRNHAEAIRAELRGSA